MPSPSQHMYTEKCYLCVLIDNYVIELNERVSLGEEKNKDIFYGIVQFSLYIFTYCQYIDTYLIEFPRKATFATYKRKKKYVNDIYIYDDKILTAFKDPLINLYIHKKLYTINYTSFTCFG